MRHLRSILYALVLAPAVWILCGVGFDQDLTGRARDNGGIESLSGVLLLVLAGAAYAILLLSPISPAGPLLAGLTFIGVGAWARIAPESYAGIWPENVASDGFNLSTPGYGLAVLLAVPLLSTALSARRWRAFEPPEILFVGTIGRARGAATVAGTPMASERTTVIPQQRQGSEFVPGFDDRTAVVPVGRPTVADDDDEKTTVLRLGSSRQDATEVLGSSRQDPTEVLGSSGHDATDDLGSSGHATEDLGAAGRDTTADLGSSGRDVTAEVAGDADSTADLSADEPTRDVVAEETTRDVTGDETTRLVLAAAGEKAQATEASGSVADGDEKTQLLTLPKADGGDSERRGEQTLVIPAGTVEPPGDRTQVLRFSAAGVAAPGSGGADSPAADVPPSGSGPGAATTAATQLTAQTAEDREGTKAMSILAAERPNPGDDPTTRLNLPATTTTHAESAERPNPERRATTATSLERPADEAADDTRPLALPTPRPSTDDDVTRRL